MTKYAYDCAWPPFPSPAEAKTNGFEGQIRYLSKTPAKNWDKGQIDAAHAAGLWVFPVWETTADRAQAGTDAGRQDCRDAESQWVALGAPSGTAIYYAVDYDPDPVVVLPYFRAIREDSHFKVGAYCSDAVAVALFKEHLINFFWQTESTGFRGRWPSPIAHIIQHVGYQRPKMTGDYDENTVIATELGQWPSTQGDWLDMTTQAEVNAMLEKVRNEIKADVSQMFHDYLVAPDKGYNLAEMQTKLDKIIAKIGA